ncbi:MAG: T9SS type A sorting domain-containing protein [Flavobacteriales bacterium]|nr:T9SS type A sorting domain-containing protein [Flavobacteriales bacterium]MDG1780000.1 T9SS type A sorting domain-containing protein [Flavobacteriales bacterium]MDG2245559.1 T9SS type A sorting domain-containing protein [Flavobacteriales bacterium]
MIHFALLPLALLCLCLTPSHYFAQVYGDPVFNWDFAEGIPADWDNASDSGIGVWEYRGPDTTPDNTVCSEGSCGGTSVPISSVTAENGFVIFDSNYWDDNIGPCGNLGAGPDPGPHEAYLTTPSLDLTAYPNIALTFQQQYRHFTGTTFVLYSIDGGETWEDAYLNPEADNTQSGASEWASVNLSNEIGGQSDVKLRFQFSGFYYWWLLDDITLYVPSQNDLIIEDVMYTTYDGLQEPNGFGDIEYDQWPFLIAPNLNFSSHITNVGAMTQTDVSMNVRITNSEGEFVYSENTDPQDLLPGAQDTAFFDVSWDPGNVVDDYTIRFKAEQVEEDQTPLNNELFKDYSLTTYTYARDEGPMEDTFIPTGDNANTTYEVGNIFEFDYNNFLFHSISIAMAEGTTPGAEIYGIVYDLSLDNVLAVTEPYTVNEYDINQVGEEKLIHLPLTEEFLTSGDTAYLVMAGFVPDGEHLAYFARSGAAPVQASLLKYPEINGLFYLLNTPVVRMNVFGANTTPGCSDPEADNFNPEATIGDGSCLYFGCTNTDAGNYDPEANFNDGSCSFTGCTDPEADNYNEQATEDDGSCQYLGCIDPLANNYDETANTDDGSCEYNEAFLGADIVEGCVPLTVQFTNQTEVIEGGSCQFDVATLLTIEDCVESFDYTFDMPGEYTVTYTYTVGEFISSFDLIVNAYDLPATPSVVYTSDGNILSCEECADAEVIIWYLNGDPVEGQNSESWNPIDNGNYSVEVYNINGCAAISEETLVVITSVESINPISDIQLYPNPTSSMLNIRSGSFIDVAQVLDMSGKVVFEMTNLGMNAQVNLREMERGVYLLAITRNGERSFHRIILQ